MITQDAYQIFLECVETAIPFAVTWRIGTYIVTTLVDWVTGKGVKL